MVLISYSSRTVSLLSLMYQYIPCIIHVSLTVSSVNTGRVERGSALLLLQPFSSGEQTSTTITDSSAQVSSQYNHHGSVSSGELPAQPSRIAQLRWAHSTTITDRSAQVSSQQDHLIYYLAQGWAHSGTNSPPAPSYPSCKMYKMNYQIK
jgi:hypothetical protein